MRGSFCHVTSWPGATITAVARAPVSSGRRAFDRRASRSLTRMAFILMPVRSALLIAALTRETPSNLALDKLASDTAMAEEN